MSLLEAILIVDWMLSPGFTVKLAAETAPENKNTIARKLMQIKNFFTVTITI
jgi:hypothetical protein